MDNRFYKSHQRAAFLHRSRPHAPVSSSPPLSFVPLAILVAMMLPLAQAARAQYMVPGGLGVSPIVPSGPSIAEAGVNENRVAFPAPSGTIVPAHAQAGPQPGYDSASADTRAAFPATIVLPALPALLPAPAPTGALPAAPTALTPNLPPLRLRLSAQLPELIGKNERSTLSSFISGDTISGRPDLETTVLGHAELRRGDVRITADRLAYDQASDQAKASGNVRVNQAGNVYQGPQLQLKLETFEGFFNQPRYEFLATGGQGQADRVDFIDQNRSIALNATYTTCRREDLPGWMPAWVISATRISADTQSNIGVADNAQLTFFGVTTPAFPSLSFPLSNDRKSGFLAPTIGLDNLNGIEVTQPYYWNIAPNRDATVDATVMSKRGVNLSGEFRYLEEKYQGTARVDFMPTDSLRNRARWGLWTRHQQTLNGSGLGLDSLNATLNINRVSDDDYWRDFSRTPSLTGRLLASEGAVRWTRGDFSGQIRALKYQTLNYDLAPITPPYDRLPQITGNYDRYDWHGFDVHGGLDYSRFSGAEQLLQLQPDGQRIFGVMQVSRPIRTPGAFIIPKVQLHATAYQFDTPFANDPYRRTHATRVLPTFSLDSGLVFERDATFFGRSLRQTLEPRAFYVYTPYRDQSRLPNYDSAAYDFNFATVYTENAFSGDDRIADRNLLTLGVTSRLIDPESGVEAARFGIAQRLRFSDRNVTLPGGQPATDRVSDLLLGAQINWNPRWSVDTTLQYNPQTHRSARNTIGARYSPGPYRTVNVAYRYRDDDSTTASTGSKSIDLGWQWPINDLWGDKGKDLGPGRGLGGDRWYAVGRLNYSLRDRRMTDAVLGLEYDGCCYVARVVYQQLSTGVTSATRRILFQIELVGLTSVGASPLRTLRQQVPGYQLLRTQSEPPSRFTNYQ
ncbi:MAG: LPS-assembly protein LptD [Variovorax sp.]